jgi:hypothetical protein
MRPSSLTLWPLMHEFELGSGFSFSKSESQEDLSFEILSSMVGRFRSRGLITRRKVTMHAGNYRGEGGEEER